MVTVQMAALFFWAVMVMVEVKDVVISGVESAESVVHTSTSEHG